MSQTKGLLFNGAFTITSLEDIFGSGTYPDKQWIVTGFDFRDNIDNRIFPDDAQIDDIFVTDDFRRFLYKGPTGPTGYVFQSHPWSDEIDLDYYSLYPINGLLFRTTPNVGLFQHGRQTLNMSESLLEFLSQKENYQIEEFLCDPTNFAQNILGSTGNTGPTEGQTGGISGDREIPVNGDEWINRDTGDRWIYQGGQWNIAPVPEGGLTGPQGDTGPQGSEGSQGITGPQAPLGGVATQLIHFDAWDNTGGQALSIGSAITVNLDQVRQNTGEFTLSADEVTVNESGTYVVIGRISTDTTDTTRSISIGFLELDTGAGFNIVPGTEGTMYNRTDINGENTSTTSCILELTSGDILRLRAEGVAGSNMVTKADGSGITILSLEGEIGDTGPTGPQGLAGPQGPQGLDGGIIGVGPQGHPGSGGGIGDIGPTGPQGPLGSVGTTGETGIQGGQGPRGYAGATGATGPQGQDGNLNALCFDYLFDTSTTFGSGPADSTLQFNTSTAQTTTTIAIDNLDLANEDISDFLTSISMSDNQIPGQIRISEDGNNTNFVNFSINGATGVSGQPNTWHQIDVIYESGFTGLGFVNDVRDNVVVCFTRTGDRGPQGPQGPQGEQGTAGAVVGAGPQGPEGPDVTGPTSVCISYNSLKMTKISSLSPDSTVDGWVNNPASVSVPTWQLNATGTLSQYIQLAFKWPDTYMTSREVECKIHYFTSGSGNTGAIQFTISTDGSVNGDDIVNQTFETDTPANDQFISGPGSGIRHYENSIFLTNGKSHMAGNIWTYLTINRKDTITTEYSQPVYVSLIELCNYTPIFVPLSAIVPDEIWLIAGSDILQHIDSSTYTQSTPSFFQLDRVARHLAHDRNDRLFYCAPNIDLLTVYENDRSNGNETLVISGIDLNLRGTASIRFDQLGYIYALQASQSGSQRGIYRALYRDNPPLTLSDFSLWIFLNSTVFSSFLTFYSIVFGRNKAYFTYGTDTGTIDVGRIDYDDNHVVVGGATPLGTISSDIFVNAQVEDIRPHLANDINGNFYVAADGRSRDDPSGLVLFDPENPGTPGIFYETGSRPIGMSNRNEARSYLF